MREGIRSVWNSGVDYASYPGNKAELSSMLAFRIFLSSGCQAGCDRPGPDHVRCGYGSPEKGLGTH